MLKKALAAMFCSLLLFGVVALVGKFVAAPSAPPPARAKVTPPVVKLKPWDGTLKRVYNTTFIRAGQELDLVEVDYAGMDTTEATVTSRWVITPASGTAEPTWLQGTPFVIRSTLNVSHAGTVTAVPDGQNWDVTSTFTDLSTADVIAAMGYKTYAGASGSPLGLDVNSPDGVFAIGLTPPPAPAGYTFAQHPAPTPPAAPKRRTSHQHHHAGGKRPAKRTARKKK